MTTNDDATLLDRETLLADERGPALTAELIVALRARIKQLEAEVEELNSVIENETPCRDECRWEDG